jgi:hypothetical protein
VSKPPADILALLAKDERVVSWADTAEGSAVAATPRGLWWPGLGDYRLIGWQSISKATWHNDVLTVIEADVVDDLLLVDRIPVRVTITVARDLPPTVRKRVEANIVHSEQVAVGGGTARLVGRKVPGEDGLRWWARLEDGAVDDGSVRLALSARLARLRDDWQAQRLTL